MSVMQGGVLPSLASLYPFLGAFFFFSAGTGVVSSFN
jgi:hypothetical protein